MHNHGPTIMLGGNAPVVRPAMESDALCLGALATQVFLDTYATSGIRPAIAAEVVRSFSTEAMRRLIDRADTHLFVAETFGHLVGFAQLALDRKSPLVESSSLAELERLYVQERFTGKGIGGILLRHAERQASRLSVRDLWLSTWVKNPRALRFYARFGYRDVGATHIDFEGESHENRVLCKPMPT